METCFMPLSFDSISHGTIAFGFFNIDSDMLLLDHYFFFATEFCDNISRISGDYGHEPIKTSWDIYYIIDREDIGDLMGAIHGFRHTGFIGEVYRGFPFPEDPDNFRQQPDGVKNQAIVQDIIKKYARHVEVPFIVDKGRKTVTLGVYTFDRPSFQALIRYVWQGGYPRWKDNKSPDYVRVMKEKIGQDRTGLFEGIVFE